jgi:hypothetical protein
MGVVLCAVDARGLVSGAGQLSQVQDMPVVNGRFSESQRAAEWSGDTRPADGAVALHVLVRDTISGRMGTLDIPLRRRR